MGFRINRGIFQYQDGEEFRNKFKIAEDGSMVEVDAEGNPTTAFLKVGDKATDADTVDGVNSGSFLRSDAADSFTSTITMSTQQAFKPANFGQGVYGRYDSTRYQHVWGMGQSWHMAENGTGLGNFYGLAYTHTNVGGQSKSGLSHQTLFVENGVTKTAIGRGVWTDGNITATGDANIGGKIDIGATTGTWVTSNQMSDSIGWNGNHGVYIGSTKRGSSSYIYGDGTYYIDGNNYDLWHEGNFNPTDKASTESVAAVDARIEEEVLPLIDTKLDAGATAVNASKSSLIQTISPTREGDAAMPSLGYSLQHFLAKGPSNNDGHILGMTWTGTSIYGAQIWVDTDPNNKMAFRSRSNAGVWTRWNNLWHDGNLTNVSQLSNDSGYINGEGIARFNRGTIDASSSVFTHMRGATSLNNPSGIGGAIKIALPTDASFTNTMMFMTIKVYEYSTSKSFTLYCGGYNYYTQNWYNTFAYIVGAETRADIPVKFGHDGERNIIWIGNPDWSWSYPNVFVSEFNSGHTQNSNWNDGWDISFDEEPAINVSGSHTAYRNITQGNISSQHVERARDLGVNYTADDWFRATGDNNHVKFYGNSRQMLFRTDGTTETYGGIGAYPFVWTYNGSTSGSRIMILHTDGRLWTARYGWLDEAFDASGASAIVNDRIETEIKPLIDTAQSAANDAQAAADLAVATADTAEARANSAREDAAAAQTTADSKLGATEKATNSHAADGVNMVGYGTNEFSFHQSSGTFAGHTGWANYFIGNHGSGSSYYNTTHIMPFWGPPQYSRLEGGTFRGPYTYWTTENFNPTDKASTESVAAAQAAAIEHSDTRIETEILPAIDGKLGTSGKAANSDKLDGYDWFEYGKNIRGTDIYADSWLRNYNSGDGLYNQATGQHWYSDGDDYWNIAGGTTFNAIRFRDEHAGTQRGLVGADNNNRIGFLDAGGAWAIRHDNDSGTNFYTDGETLEFRVGRDKVTGGYGTVQTDTTRNAWGGYSIAGRVVFMHDHSNSWGIYNDAQDEWMIYGTLNGQVELRHNGVKKLETTSGGATVTGTMTATAFSGDGSALTGISAGSPPVQAFVEGGNDSTLASIMFSPGEGAATFTLADGQTFRLAFAR